MDVIICSECGHQNPVEASVCEQCNADLNAIKSIMDTANTHYNEALALAHSGRLDEALGLIEAALALSAQNPEYHNLQGTIYGQKGLYSESIRAWERCLTLNPEMEKAYKNISKARRMEEEAAEEQRKRPFLLTSIATSALALLLLITTAYFGVQSYFASRTIHELSLDKADLSDQIQTVTTQYRALNEKFPEGLDALLQKVEKLQIVADERQSQMAALTEQRREDAQNHNSQLTQYRNQIKTLQTTNKDLETKLQEVHGLRAKLASQEGKELSLQQKISDQATALTDCYTNNDDLTKRISESLLQLQNTRKERDQLLYDLKQEHATTEETFRAEIRNLRDTVATLERKIADIKYADGLVAEAQKNLDRNNFQLAFQNVRDALTRYDEHTLAAQMHESLEIIMSDPVEQELRLQAAVDKEAQRQAKKQQLITAYLEKAASLYKSGEFTDAVEYANRALSLSPTSGDRERGQRLAAESEERNREIAMLLLEAQKDINENNLKQAQAALKKIFRYTQSNEQANQLMAELSQR
jgi:tetratricopeptide (TPR) repeat protein